MTRKRILFLYLGFLAVLMAGTAVVLRETGVSRTFVENVLSEFLDRELFSLRDANVDIGGGTVTLRGFQITTPDADPARAHVQVDQVEVGVDTNPLGEVGRVRSVRAKGMRLEIDLAAGRFPDLQRLLRPQSATPSAEPQPPPPVEITDSSLQLRLSKDAPVIEFTEVQLDLLPEEPGSFAVALSGSMRSPNGHRVAVEGRGDLAKPEFRALLRIVDAPLGPEIARPYSAKAVDFLADVGIGGTARSIVIWAEYPDSRAEKSAAPEIVAGVRLDLADVRCSVPELPYPIVGATARINADLRDEGSVTFVVDDASVDGNVHVRGVLSRVLGERPLAELQVDADDVLVGPQLGRALAPLADARSVWDAFQPSGGRANAKVHLITARDDAPERLSVEVAVRGVGARFVGFEARDGTREFGFPFPMEDVHGTVRIREGEVSIDDVHAQLAGHDVTVRGEILPRSGEPTQIELELRSPELEFSPQMRDALQVLDPEFAAIYDDYAPRGATALEVSVRTGGGFADPGVRVRLRPLGASAAWAGMPCRVDQVTGVVDIGTDGVLLDLEGMRGPSVVSLEGRFPQAAAGSRPETGPAALLRVQAKDLRIDDELVRAMHVLSASLGETIDLLGASGRADVDLNTWRDADAEAFGYDVRVDLADAVIRIENLPLPTRGLNGSVFVHGEGTDSRIEVAGVQGWIENGPGREPARLLVQGTVAAHAEDYATDLTAIVRDLELNGRLGAAMNAFGAFDAETWRVLQPSGNVDVVWRQTKALGEPAPHQNLRIQLMGVRSGASFLPGPAEAMFGDVEVDDGVASFHDVRCTMVGTRVQCTSGTAAHEPGRTVFDAEVTSDDFPVDERLANLLDGPLKRTYLDREVRGRVRIHGLRIRLEFADDRPGFTSRLRGDVTALGLRLRLGTEIHDVTGAWTIDDALVESGGGQVRGRVQGGGFAVLDHRVSGVSTRFEADAETVRFSGVQAHVHGGQISGLEGQDADLVYRLAGEGVLSFGLAWGGISLDQLARASGVRNERWRGNLSGTLRLDRLEGTNIVDSVGAGELRITEGDLGQVPAFTAIYSYLAEPRRPRFEEMSMTFSIGSKKVDIQRLEVKSPLLTATGRGTVDMDGYVDMRIDFPDFFGKSADWLFIPQMLRMLTSELAQFQIFGYLRSPQTRPLWLGRDSAGRVPLAPIPVAR